MGKCVFVCVYVCVLVQLGKADFCVPFHKMVKKNCSVCPNDLGWFFSVVLGGCQCCLSFRLFVLCFSPLSMFVSPLYKKFATSTESESECASVCVCACVCVCVCVCALAMVAQRC